MSGRGRALGRRVGAVGGRGRFRTVEPVFERGPEVGVAKGSIKAAAGELVIADFGPLGARILRSLGRADIAADVVSALVDDAGLRRGFGVAVENEARDAAARVAREPEDRADLTDLPTFTVDPATARDFDDAISAERDGDDIVLRVHIADVAAHVRPGGGSTASPPSGRRASTCPVPLSRCSRRC